MLGKCFKTKLEKFTETIQLKKDFVKAYIGLADIWIVLIKVKPTSKEEIKKKEDSTKEYNDIKRKYGISHNILLINREDESDLKEDLGDKLNDYKVITFKLDETK